ncbi:MAG: dTDP-glucose 4,6-dehydratase [Deltaproteobacteria bacterium]|nr:dTDP-glucose 4,6-dehydratase [Deltaproteobacteria bacterium]
MGETFQSVLVTGGCGFIGSHFVELMLSQYPNMLITNVDALTYAAHPDTPARLSAVGGGRYEFLQKNINDVSLGADLDRRGVDVVVNFAAETHVDRSILEPHIFLETNVVGLQNLLTLCRKRNLRLVQVSTDEVYGSLEPSDKPFTEQSPLSPNSPYAAAKASADLIAFAAQRTYKQDVVITRCSNNFGPGQFPEKLLPLLIANASEGLPIPVYGDGKQVRDWIYVTDHCAAVDRVMCDGKSGEAYNISAYGEQKNIDLIKRVLDIMNKPHSLIQFVGDRPAHDRRYALENKKIGQELGWSPKFSFDEGLAKTVAWYRSNEAWLKKVRGQDYQKYYKANYDSKMKQTERAV